MLKTYKLSGYKYHLRLWILSALIALGGIACSHSYVVLLENNDGTVGKVKVTTTEGTTVLDKPREGDEIGGEAGKTFVVSEEQINEDFGAAISASPKKPVSFYLYFKEGTTELTHLSAGDIPKIIKEISSRPVPDISIIGHTDTVGKTQFNEKLSLKRAKLVASLLDNVKAIAVKVTLDWHGEMNLLVPTPDDTDEPRNRRVEVTVR